MTRRVQLSYDAEARGVVVTEGPEVSEVKFDDKTFRYIPNEDLADEKGADPHDRLRHHVTGAIARGEKTAIVNLAPDAKIELVAKTNPRRAGTAAFKKWEALVAFLEKRPTATAEEVHINTIYDRVDMKFDIAKGNIKMKEG